MDYCYNLEENGYTDWVLPTLEQLLYATGGGLDLTDLYLPPYSPAGTLPPGYSMSNWSDSNSVSNAWNATSAIFNPSVLDVGIHTFRYTAPISGNCPADFEDIIIEVFNQPTAIISTDDPNNTICDGDPINLQFNLTGSANYIVDYIDPNSGPQTVTLNAAGNDASTNLPIQIFPTIGSNLYTITNIEDDVHTIIIFDKPITILKKPIISTA